MPAAIWWRFRASFILKNGRNVVRNSCRGKSEFHERNERPLRDECQRSKTGGRLYIYRWGYPWNDAGHPSEFWCVLNSARNEGRSVYALALSSSFGPSAAEFFLCLFLILLSDDVDIGRVAGGAGPAGCHMEVSGQECVSFIAGRIRSG
jgi:hypothetical protein